MNLSRRERSLVLRRYFFSYNFLQFFWLSTAVAMCNAAISVYINSLPFKAKLQGKDNALMWMRKHERWKSVVFKLIMQSSPLYPHGFTGLLFHWDGGWHFALGSTEELLRLPKSHLRNWLQDQKVSYQICLLPQVSRSGPRKLGFFLLETRFVMETVLKSPCDEQHPQQAEDLHGNLEQNSKLSGMYWNRDCSHYILLLKCCFNT